MILASLYAFGLGVPARESVIETVLHGAHWYGCPPRACALLEQRFLRLARMDYPSLRRAYVAYLSPRKPSNISPDEASLRQYDVAIVARAKYFDDFMGSKREWFGPGILFTPTPGWIRSKGRLRLQLSDYPYIEEPDYDGVGELDYLHRMHVMRALEASLTRRSGKARATLSKSSGRSTAFLAP